VCVCVCEREREREREREDTSEKTPENEMHRRAHPDAECTPRPGSAPSWALAPQSGHSERTKERERERKWERGT
jgi:hypothetical protein